VISFCHPVVTAEHEVLRGWVREFAESAVRPHIPAMEREEFPLTLFREAGRLGLLGIQIPVEYGGAGLDTLSAGIVREELARVSAAFAASVIASSVYFGVNIAKRGTPAQKARYLPQIASGEKIGAWVISESDAGSDARGISTTTTERGDRLVVNGAKTFCTNGPVADFVIVQTRRIGLAGDAAGTSVILERGMEGFTAGSAFHKLGYRGSPTGELYIDNVEIDGDHVLGVDGEGFEQALAALDVERVLGIFSGLGIAQACLDEMTKYARERRQFGRPIADFQLIKSKIADAATAVDVIRTYAYNLVWRLDSGLPIRKQAAIGKYMMAEAVMRTATEAVQLHGGYGFTTDFPVERFFRDAKLLAIGGGTSEIQTLVIARQALDESAKLETTAR
jgi:alkylation response protein AidB-like acyl-CoA dehydrogenase